MATVPFSAMIVAANVANTDVVAGLVGGANAVIPRAILLQGSGSDDIAISAGGTNFVIRHTGNAEVNLAAGVVFNIHSALTSGHFTVSADGTMLHFVDAGGTWEVDQASGAVIALDISGNFVFGSAAGGFVFIAAGGSTINLQDAGGIQFGLDAGQKVFVPFNPGNPADWAGAPPADWEDAINRMAHWVATHLGAIP